MAVNRIINWTDIGTVEVVGDGTIPAVFTVASVAGSDRALVLCVGIETGTTTEYQNPTVVEIRDDDDDSLVATASLIVSAAEIDLSAGYSKGSDRNIHFAVFNEAAVAAVMANGGNMYVRETAPNSDTTNNPRARYAVYENVNFATIASNSQCTTSPTNLSVTAPAAGISLSAMLSSTVGATITWSAPAARVSDWAYTTESSADMHLLEEAVSAGTVNSLWSSSGSAFNPPHVLLVLPEVSGGDVTAPVLSSPTATKTGSTTASGTVTTDEGNGTLYKYVSVNASETAATIKASGTSQAVSTTGSQAVSFTGLTASTAYYAHYVQDDAASNESNVVSSAQFTTDPVPTTLSADSITAGTIRAGDTVTIQLSNVTNASGKTLSIPQGAITPSAQDINSISFVAPDLKTFGDKTGDYNTNITITVTDAGESDTIVFQIAPDVGDEVGAITAVEGIYAEAAFSGVAVTDLYYTATISGADFAVGAVPVLGTEQTFNLWIQDQTDGVWGSPFVVTIPGSATPGSTDAIILRPVLRDVLRPVLRDIFNEG